MTQRICSVDECEKAAHCRGWCPMHYQRWRTNGTTDLVKQPPKPRPRRVGIELCEIDGCGKVIRARGWCVAHWSRWKRHGSPTARLPGEVVDGKRICSRCKQDLPLSEYGRAGESWCRRCFNENQRIRKAETYVPRPRWPAVCELCGVEFLADKRRSIFCSRECFAVGRHKRNLKYSHARRVRQRGVTGEKFFPREIFERDDWCCGICSQPIDRSARAPHPMSPSIDHIVPISRGGEHSRANVQAAHLGCNVRKGARLIAKPGSSKEDA